MALTRATVEDRRRRTQHENTTTSFVDQNQTYTSHASHQVFLREYARMRHERCSAGGGLARRRRPTASGSVATARSATGPKSRRRRSRCSGINLSDFDVHNVPLLLTDQYGKFIPGANGYAQIVMAPDLTHATNWYREGNPDGSVTTAGSIGTGHAFLNDIAHHAAPGRWDHDGDHQRRRRLTRPPTATWRRRR